MKILFITGNKNKLSEALEIMPQIEGCDVDLPEIQEIDTKKIIEHKLLEAIKQKPNTALIVEDQSLTIDGLNGLPGPLIKWFLMSLENKGLYKMAKSMGNCNAQATTTIGYCNEIGEIYYFDATVSGKIVAPIGDHGWGWDPIFLPSGYNLTLGQMTADQKNELSSRRVVFDKLKKFLNL